MKLTRWFLCRVRTAVCLVCLLTLVSAVLHFSGWPAIL